MATDGQTDRFDGVLDSSYAEDVRVITNKTFEAWDKKPEAFNWLQMDSPQFSRDFRRKFPFAGERLDQRCFRRSDFGPRISVAPGVVRRFNTPADENKQAPTGSRTVTSTTRIVRQDPRRSQEELEIAQVISCYLGIVEY